MKFVIFAICVVLASAATDYQLFTKFKAEHHKVYGTAGEESARYAIFRANLRKAEELTRQSDDAVFGVTQFMDLTADEFRETYLNLNVQSHRDWIKTLKPAVLPELSGNVDWRNTNNPLKTKAVTSVKDQAQCGSCWAFSAAAALEGCAMIKSKPSSDIDVSAQQIVDCCSEGGSSGCSGGYPDQCLNWATEQDMATWKSYPYNARQGSCQQAKEVAVPAGTCEYVSVQSGSEPKLQSAIQVSPVSICIAADILQTYSSGIIKGSSCTKYSQVDHAVLLVAWLDDVYTVKNSWGTRWGEQGFFRMQADVNCLYVTKEFTSYAVPK